jgi:lysophospholipase L1-like esterase
VNRQTLLHLIALCVAAGTGWAAERSRVLLIGDSIAGGYAATVSAELKGLATVVKNPGNAGATALALAKPADNTVTNATNLDWYLALGPFDVIHFNWGLHDLKRGGIPKEQYLTNLDKLVARLQQTKAKLIFATTTPVPPVNNEGRIPSKVVEFNQAAVELMKQRGVAVDDLYGAILPHQAEVQLKDNVHFGREGYALLGKQVANAIRAVLDGKNIEPPATSTPTVIVPKRQVPASDAVKDLGKLVKYTVEPAMEHKLDYLKVGAIQHSDRPYVYSWLPDEMVGSVVFQGSHRAPIGTTVKIEVFAPTTIYFFFYPGGKYSGGYDKIFPGLKGWRKLDDDVRYGHAASDGKGEKSKRMVAYRTDVQPSIVEIPATTSENAVFAFAVKAME